MKAYTGRVLTPRVWYVLATLGLLGLGLLLGLTAFTVPAGGIAGSSPVSCGSPWFPAGPDAPHLAFPAGGDTAEDCHRHAAGRATAAAVFALAGLLGGLALLFHNMTTDGRRPSTTD